MTAYHAAFNSWLDCLLIYFFFLKLKLILKLLLIILKDTTYFSPVCRYPSWGTIGPSTAAVGVRFGQHTITIREDGLLCLADHLHTKDCPYLPPCPTSNTAVGPVAY